MPRPDDSQPFWSRAELIAGAWAIAPALPGMLPFALVCGAIAAQKAFSLPEALVMSGVVYAGMAQLVTLQIWPTELTLGAVASLVLVTLTVNMRFMLLSASMRPWFASLPAWQSYALLSINTDAGWIVAMRYRNAGGTDPAFYLGGAATIWVFWTAMTVPGYLLGAWLSSPQRYGLDVVMPAFFAAMLVPMWRGARRAIPWIIAGAVALAVDLVFASWWFIVAGALAGTIAGGFLRDE